MYSVKHLLSMASVVFAVTNHLHGYFRVVRLTTDQTKHACPAMKYQAELLGGIASTAISLQWICALGKLLAASAGKELLRNQ